MKKTGNQLATKMIMALLLGLLCGLLVIALRENLLANGNVNTWKLINNLLFADISQKGNEQAIGLFYIIGQMFIKSLQVIIVPMVFTSITLAMIKISDAKKLGRISSKTISTFLLTSVTALLIAGIFGYIAYQLKYFGDFNSEGLSTTTNNIGSNPLLILVNAIPANIVQTFSSNSSVLAVVVLAVACGFAINGSKNKITYFTNLCEEISNMVTICLSFVINKFGPMAIFVLLTRTFAAYGIEYLKPAFGYMLLVTIILLVYLIFGYAFFVSLLAKINPMPFVKKITKVALFGFSTSSSAATLPLSKKTCTEELGVPDEIASFVLPLGMTVNMDGTAIMQVIAAIFIASCGGYELNLISILIIAILALVASIGTPAAPGAGAIVLFTILSGMGYSNEMALMAYTVILAINRPIEMLVTSLNCVGDCATAIIVAKSENSLDQNAYASNLNNGVESKN